MGQTEGKKQRYKEGKMDEARYRVDPQVKMIVCILSKEVAGRCDFKTHFR
jgi:hypothetical protein